MMKIVLLVIFAAAISSDGLDTTKYNVTFSLYQKSQNAMIPLTDDAFKQINPNWSTKIIIESNMPFAKDSGYKLTNEFEKTEDYNVIFAEFDVAQAHHLEFNETIQEIPKSAEIITNFLRTLIDRTSIDPTNIHIIGFCLFAHVARIAAHNFQKQTNTQIGRLTALDPSNINIANDEPFKTAATIVDVLHTDGGNMGIEESVGTVDFFVNEGKALQPGCQKVENGDKSEPKIRFCSHLRALEVYVEAIGNPNGFLATKCSTWEDFTAGKCEANTKIHLGANLDSNVEGSYFLRTNDKPPYSME